MKNILLCFAAVGTLAACTYAHPAQSPQLTFDQYTAISLNAQNVTVQDTPLNPNDVADVSGQFVLSPYEAIKRYSANRFQSSGAQGGEFTLAIDDSRIHFRQIDQDSKVLKWADIGQQDEYSLFLQVRVIAQPGGFNGRQITTIKMNRTLIMPSSVTLADREMRQTKFLEQLISDLDKRVLEALEQTPAIKN